MAFEVPELLSVLGMPIVLENNRNSSLRKAIHVHVLGAVCARQIGIRSHRATDIDESLFMDKFQSKDIGADLDGSGQVNTLDIATFRNLVK